MVDVGNGGEAGIAGKAPKLSAMPCAPGGRCATLAGLMTSIPMGMLRSVGYGFSTTLMQPSFLSRKVL